MLDILLQCTILTIEAVEFRVTRLISRAWAAEPLADSGVAGKDAKVGVSNSKAWEIVCLAL